MPAACGLSAPTKIRSGFLLFEVRELRLEVRRLIRRVFAIDDVAAVRLHCLHELIGFALTEGRAVVDHRDALGLRRRHCIGACGAGVLRVARNHHEDVLVAAAADHRISGRRIDDGQARFLVEIRSGNGRAGIEVPDDNRHASIHELLRDLHADTRVGLIVFGDEFERDRLAVDLDALRFRVVERHFDAVLQVFAVTGVGPGERCRKADFDDRLRARGERCDGEQCRNCNCDRGESLSKTHVFSFLSASMRSLLWRPRTAARKTDNAPS